MATRDDDFSDLFTDDAAEERESYAHDLGPVDDERSLDEIGAEQWEALFEEFLESGQLSEEQLDAIRDWYGEEDDGRWDAYIVDVDGDAQQGGTP